MKKCLKIIFCLSLLAFMLGIGNVSASAEEVYDVWVGSTRVTSSNMNRIDGENGGYVKYDPIQQSMYFYDFKGVKGTTPSGAMIESNDRLIIYGNLDLSGEHQYYGIYTVNGELKINANVTVPGMTAVYCEGDIVFYGGDIFINGTEYGIFMNKENGSIDFRAGKVRTTGYNSAVWYQGDGSRVQFFNGMTPYCSDDYGGYNICSSINYYDGGYIALPGDSACATEVVITKEEPESYPVWIGEQKITSLNKDRIEGKNGGYASYNPETKTLTFYNFKDVKYPTDYLVYAKNDLNVKGTASFSEKPYFDMVGIRSDGKLSISGNISVDTMDRCLYGTDGIVISGKDTVVEVAANTFPCSCIYSEGVFELKDGIVSCYSMMDGPTGILAQGVVISGGTLDISVERGDGIYVTRNMALDIKGGKVNVYAYYGV